MKQGGEPSNWLRIVGSGIRLGQLTYEAELAITSADVVFALVTNSAALEMIRSYHTNVVDLSDCYGLGKQRDLTYREMADRVLAEVRAGKNVCVAIYGHPLVFATPGRLAVADARKEGYPAEFLPGISATDSLFCDLEIDPAVHGCQVYCATAFVRESRAFDPRSVLTLWQVRIIGESRLMDRGKADDLDRLCDRLIAVYGPAHPVTLYEASTTPLLEPEITTIELSRLRSATIRPCCTLVVPPIHQPNLIRASSSSSL